MVIRPRDAAGVAVATASLVWAYSTWAAGPATPSVDAVQAETGALLPRIDLDRATRGASASKPAGRDLFSYGRGDASSYPAPVIRLAPTPPPTPIPLPTPEPEPTPTPWPVLNIVLIGVLELSDGRKGASFVKDGDIVLVGTPGAVLANAFRVVSVAPTSAEIEELGSGRVRRLPLKTN
jgi:hypothetical protein